MKIRNTRSLTIISVYVALNVFIIFSALKQQAADDQVSSAAAEIAPEYTEIHDLDYFHLKAGTQQMSLAAIKLRSQGQELAEFTEPRGIYNYQDKNKTINYEALQGVYRKEKDLLLLEGKVKLTSEEADYSAARIKYYFKKDLILGYGGVAFNGLDLKSQDKLEITADNMKSHPNIQFSRFNGNVNGSMQRKKKYEGKMTFSSQQLQLDGLKSLAHLEGNVKLNRQSYLITAGKADITLENYNKSLKYFVFNDDVKVTEKLQTPEGVSYRKAFSERLEGFGKEQKMVLSGAPKVEHGKDVVKGYRITIRENMDLIEVDDSMSDMQVKKKNVN